MTVRRFSAEEKRTIVMAYLSGARMAEVCREHQVSGPTVYTWRDRSLEGGLQGRAGDTATQREALLERENARLRDVVAELTLANDIPRNLAGTEADGGDRARVGGDCHLPSLRPRRRPAGHPLLRAVAADAAPLPPGDPYPALETTEEQPANP